VKLWLALLLLAAPAAYAQTAQVTPSKAPVKPALPRPVLVEMFVSQSCSSCPPADALLQALASSDKGILPLSLNVTYWNNLGWHDTDSMDETTVRQFWYAGLSGSQNVYTPEAVVDGTRQLAGNDRHELTAAIAAARAEPAGNVQIAISGAVSGGMLTLEVSAGQGAGQIILFGYDTRHSTAVTAGENAGATITEINVVRSLTSLGPWDGLDEQFKLPRPAGQHIAVVLQAKDGSVLGLASL
jgi:hypothetical protein